MGMTLDEVIGGTDAATHLDAAHDAAWRVTDPSVLAVCRLRTVELLGGDTSLLEPPPVPVTEPDPAIAAAAIAFTEQYIIDVAGMTDELVAPLRDALGDQGLVDFVNALLVVEQRARLQLTWGAVL